MKKRTKKLPLAEAHKDLGNPERIEFLTYMQRAVKGRRFQHKKKHCPSKRNNSSQQTPQIQLSKTPVRLSCPPCDEIGPIMTGTLNLRQPDTVTVYAYPAHTITPSVSHPEPRQKAGFIDSLRRFLAIFFA